MSIAESQPFSLVFAQEANGSNGLTYTESQTEFIDNAQDAQSSFHMTILTEPHPDTGLCMKADLDFGNGIEDIAHVYGLGKRTQKKESGNRGLKNKGHLAAVGRFQPIRITYYTKCNGKFLSMDFEVQAMLDAISKTMENDRDYRQVDHRDYMTIHKCWNDDIRKRLNQLISLVHDDSLLCQILNNDVDSYFLQIMEYNNDKQTEINEEFEKTYNSFKLFYYKSLENNFNIVLQPVSGEQISLTPDDAVNPLGNPEFSRILIKCKIIQVDGNKTYLSCELSIGDCSESKKFWFIDTPVDKIKRIRIVEEEPVLTNIVEHGDFELRITVVNQEETNKQKDFTGFGSDELRGLYCLYIDRILGMPYFSKLWGAPRNAGGIRAELKFNNQSFAENYLSIQSQKHRTNLDNSHRILQGLFKYTIGNIIKKYSNYMTDSSSKGITHWNLNDVYNTILEVQPTKEKEKEKEKEKDKNPIINFIKDYLEDEDEVKPKPKPVQPPTVIKQQGINFEITQQHLIVSDGSNELYRFNALGNGSQQRDYFKILLEKMSPTAFKEYIDKEFALRFTYNL